MILESVTSPPEEGDEPEPEYASKKDAIWCADKLKIYIWKMENVSEDIFKMTDDLEHFMKKGMLTKLKWRKFEDFFSVKLCLCK
jgi:hypothetical protein